MKTKPEKIVLIGLGGHARTVVAILETDPRFELVGALDAKPGRALGLSVLGDDRELAALLRRGVRHFAMGIGGIADNGPRRHAFERACAAGLKPIAIVHPRAVVAADARIGAGSFVGPGAIVNAGARVGRNAIVNSGAIVEHDARIGDHVHVATGAVVCGGVRIGAGAHVGANATIRQYLRIGAGALIALGSGVIADVRAGVAVGGLPARPIAAKKNGKKT